MRQGAFDVLISTIHAGEGDSNQENKVAAVKLDGAIQNFSQAHRSQAGGNV
jgi:hypothetical protein